MSELSERVAELVAEYETKPLGSWELWLIAELKKAVANQDVSADTMHDQERAELRAHLEHCLTLGGGNEISGNVMDALMASVRMNAATPLELTDEDRVNNSAGTKSLESAAQSKGAMTFGDVRRWVALGERHGVPADTLAAAQTVDNPYRTGFVRLLAVWRA